MLLQEKKEGQQLRHPASPPCGFMSQQGQKLKPGITTAQLSTRVPNLSWQTLEHAGSSGALRFPASV